MNRFCLAVAFVVATAVSSTSAQSQQAPSLASRLPALSSPSSNAGSTDVLTGARGNKNQYNLQLAGIAALLAADDSGIERTLNMKAGSYGNRISNDITRLGDAKYVAPLLAGVYLSGGSRNETLATHATIAVFKAGVLGVLAKYAVGRERPENGGHAATFAPFSTRDQYNSFPSGHTLVAFSAATVWAHDKPREKYVAFGLASAVGLSRVALGAHWPTDVLAGALLGITQGRQVDNGNTNLLSFRF